MKAAKKAKKVALRATNDGDELVASMKRGIRYGEHDQAALADLLTTAIGATSDGLHVAIEGIADEVELLNEAICNGRMAENAQMSPVLLRLESRIRVIAEVQRRIDGEKGSA